VATYRCFCLTTDNRIIAGAHISAADVQTALELARRNWQLTPGFHSIEVWFGHSRLHPPAKACG
jgi:hypothetical protein